LSIVYWSNESYISDAVTLNRIGGLGSDGGSAATKEDIGLKSDHPILFYTLYRSS